jgi:hypothetical protein
MLQELHQKVYDARMLAWEVCQTSTEPDKRKAAGDAYVELVKIEEALRPLVRAE